MTYYIKQGNTYSITNEENIDIRKELPVGTYMVSVSQERGYFLTRVDDLEVKGKIYGDLEPRAERILATFADRPRNTGVLLYGEKGSGKTLLSKRVSQMCREGGVPTVVVNQPFCGDAFNAFMQGIDQPTVIIFDEFEKVYEPEQQERILTLLDGVFPSKKLFILTVNDMKRVDRHLQNRPGRLFYSIEYGGLSREFIEEYCNDNLDNKDYISGVCNVSTLFDSFNFDMLQSLVEEMNRYGETPKDALEILNIKPDAYNFTETYEIEAHIPGWDDFYMVGGVKEISSRSPIASAVAFEAWASEKARKEYYDSESDDEELKHLYRLIRLENTDIKKMDGNGSFLYELKDGTKITLRKKTYSRFDYRDHI